MKVCTYCMKVDRGLAPNPFFGVCSLALCTPNHMRAKLHAGDYLIGLSSKGLRKQHRLTKPVIIYAMEIDRVLDLDDYYKQYPKKRGNSAGTNEQQVGDALYRKDDRGIIEHIPESKEHISSEAQVKDIRGNRVFIGEKFWYFGKESEALPDEQWGRGLSELFCKPFRGIRYIYGTDKAAPRRWTKDDLENFKKWLRNFRPGRIGMPFDIKGAPSTCGQISATGPRTTSAEEILPPTGESGDCAHRALGQRESF